MRVWPENNIIFFNGRLKCQITMSINKTAGLPLDRPHNYKQIIMFDVMLFTRIVGSSNQELRRLSDKISFISMFDLLHKTLKLIRLNDEMIVASIKFHILIDMQCDDKTHLINAAKRFKKF